MEIRVLGANNIESPATRHTCFLVDGVMAIDAGSIVTSLGLEEQAQIKEVLLTHRHFDHTRDLPTLALGTLDTAGTTEIHGINDTLEAVHSHLLNGAMYPDFTQRMAGDGWPRFRLNPVQQGVEIQVLDYKVTPVPMPHSAPSVAYVVQAPSGACAAFTGDTRGNLAPLFHCGVTPQDLFVEVTFPNRSTELAYKTGHLSPGMLQEELRGLLEQGIKVPRVIAVHLNLGDEKTLGEELAHVASELGVTIELGYRDMRVTL